MGRPVRRFGHSPFDDGSFHDRSTHSGVVPAFIEDMQIKGLLPKPQMMYLRAAKNIPIMLTAREFRDFDLGAPAPDENTIRHFRNQPTEIGTSKRVMQAFDWLLHKKGYKKTRTRAGP